MLPGFWIRCRGPLGASRAYRTEINQEGLTRSAAEQMRARRSRMALACTPESLAPYLPPGARVEAMPDTGHFVHIERPREVADRVLAFLS